MNIPKRLPKRDSATGRAIATFLQIWSAVLLALPAVALFLSDGELHLFVTQYFPKFVPVLTVLAALATLLSNLARKNVKNY